jgi:hypothetical protein
MSGMTNISPVSHVAPSGVAKSLARIEKPSAGSGLHDGATANEERRGASAQQALPQRLSHSDTEDAPRWYGPRLTAPFVAQVLGQVLPRSNADAYAASAAYRSAPVRVPTGICLDREV